ncbi:hypothetical protein J2T57_000631 [Natronocella acetinitrilica]|uniref:Uncharacterized protein n=1 Tax=Natronocella acetinitrilica TaxID=414046 RepID=A0AAE3G120_9GAMM|nr:hypothetical protein [Natronocella acetinitrilica]MCP1673539.1 hypothetical protein [Natronocella acetinitrilica]
MQITSFDDLKTAGLAEPEPQRLLILLLRADPGPDGKAVTRKGVTRGRGTLTPVMATDLELTPRLNLAAIIEEADSLGEPWQLMMVSSLGGRNGHMPTTEDAGGYLEGMVQAVREGHDLSRYAVFDRAGSPVKLQAED